MLVTRSIVGTQRECTGFYVANRTQGDPTAVIRYVLAVILTAALLGVGFGALERAGTERSEHQLEGQIDELDAAAMALVEHEDPPGVGQAGPRRVVDLTLPTDGLVSESVETLVIEPDYEKDVTVVSYRFDDRADRTVVIGVVIERAGAGSAAIDLSGHGGSITLTLELRRPSPDSKPVLEATVEY